MKLTGKTALVTGGTKGIGKATVEMLIRNKCNIVINYASDTKSAEELVGIAKSRGVEAYSIRCDITSEKEVQQMFINIKDMFKSLDILVNNAGIFDSNDHPLGKQSFEHIFKVNFLAQVNVTNEALKLMKNGKIIFVSSVHGIIGHGRPNAIAYSAMKAGLDSYMKNLAKFLAPEILVNSIAPGKTLTPMWGDSFQNLKDSELDDHLTRKWIEPGEIASGISFLLTNDSVCGEILVIDGGMSLKSKD